MAKEWVVECKRCRNPISYSGMMYEKMASAGQSRPEYCDECRKQLTLEKMTMGAAYFSAQTLPGTDLSIALPGELGMVHHDPRPHKEKDIPGKFDPNKFGATPGKIVEIYNWLKDVNHQVAIVVGPTGSGKSTALPYWLIFPPEGVPADFFTRDGQILITQPRILATTTIADYMGKLVGSSVGRGFDIGYRYSKDRNADRFNAAYFATDGTLINMIKNGQLSELGVIVIDEAHERSLNIDIILRLLKDQLPLYPHLKLLIVSATINKDLFLNFFGGDTAAVIEFEGKRKFDYKVYYSDEPERLPYEEPYKLKTLLVPAVVKKTVWLLNEVFAGRKNQGHILAFLHGVRPIEEAVSMLRQEVEGSPALRSKVEVFPLYSDLTPQQTDWAMNGKENDKIRVVFSTNVAEASVTVEGVVHIVETGVENQADWKVETAEKRVGLTLISQANARQRWGRAGRTADGEVHCLYTKDQFERFIQYPVPAIQRSSMDDIILILKDMGVDDLADGWIEGPKVDEMKRSLGSLVSSGALDSDEMLTEYGTRLRKFAYSASLTDLIVLADQFGCAVEIATLLPVIRDGGIRYLMQRDENWSKEERLKAKKSLEIMQANCKDDVEFILMIYYLLTNPPSLVANKDKKMSKQQLREAWANEYFVEAGVYEDWEAEKEKILSLLNKRRKDQNTRMIDFKLINRVRVVLAYCLPFNIADAKYTYNAKMESIQLALDKDEAESVVSSKKGAATYLSLAKKLADWEERFKEDIENRLLTGVTESVDAAIGKFEEEWENIVQSDVPIGSVVEVKVVSVAKFGVFWSLSGGLKGFTFIGNINPYRRIDDITQMFVVGETYLAKVMGFDREREQIKLTLAITENSPQNFLKVGSSVVGKVVRVETYGAFLELRFGYLGLIHLSNFGRRIQRVTEMVGVGDIVKAEVLEVREKNGRPEISLRYLSK